MNTELKYQRFVATHDNDRRVWTITERNGQGKVMRVIADYIPTAMWAEAIVEWANSLDLLPELASDPRRIDG